MMRAAALALLVAIPALAEVAPPSYVGKWRLDTTGKPLPCPVWSVLRSKEKGWPGKCLNLKHLMKTDNSTCANKCVGDPECTVWQETTGSNCWLGGSGLGEGAFAENCWGRAGDPWNPFAAARLQHGSVKVIKKLTAVWVAGLKTVGIGSLGNGTVNIDRCRLACYSDIHCNYWQYGSSGCEVETKTHKAGKISNATAEAKVEVTGEVIEHYCEAHTKKDEHSNTKLIVGIAALAGLALITLAVLASFCCSKKETKPKRTRAIKLAAAKPQETVPLVAPALPPPVYPMPAAPAMQPVVSMQAAPVMQPVVSMQAAPVMSMQAAPSYTMVRQF